MSDDKTCIKTENGSGHASATDRSSYYPADDRQQDSELSDFDADYEESERDTDYAFAYEDERSSEEDAAQSPEGGDSAGLSAAWQVQGGQAPAFAELRRREFGIFAVVGAVPETKCVGTHGR